MLTGIAILACWVFLGVYWNISARSIIAHGGGPGLERKAGPYANLAGVHPVECHLGVSVWNGGVTKDGRFGPTPGRSGGPIK